jgi:hypothetical protein
MPPRASLLVEVGIAGIALLVCAGVVLATWRFADRRSAQRLTLALGLWLLVSGALAHRGFFATEGTTPPRFLWLILPTFALPVGLAFSSVGQRLAAAPLPLLIAAHGFRLPLELVMHRAAVEGVMPPQMTYSGSNFDIVTGATALVVGGLAVKGLAPRWLVLAWNTLGTLLLLNVITVAILSLPFIRAFGDEPRYVNTWVAYFPFVWLPAGLVSAALLGHLLLWRRLLSRGMRGRVLPMVS